MTLDRVLTDVKNLSYLFVAFTESHILQNLKLALGKLRTGHALGKVKQLDERYPAIEEQAASRPTAPIGTSVEQLDLGTVMKASHAVAGEIG